MDVHPLAKAGFVKGDVYHAHRSSYTPQTVNLFVDHFSELRNTPAASHYDVLELGAGTGKFTEVFLPALPKGTRYLATDASSGFLKTLNEVAPGVETRQVIASSIPLPDSSVKMVVCAQCFHWFCDQDSVREIRRVLTPDGKLALVWNQNDMAVPWFASVRELMLTGHSDSPPARLTNGQWKNVIMAFPGFGQPLDVRLPGIGIKGTLEDIVSNLKTSSLMASLPDHEKAKMADSIRDIIRKELGDSDGSNVQLPMYTEIWIFPSV